MSSFDLLGAVLPVPGRFCVVGIGKYVDQSFLDTREEVTAKAEELVRRGFDAYFGCGKVGTEDSREKTNIVALKSLWLDIDCGAKKHAEGKGYLDQRAGLDALREFCKRVGLRRPILVNSGYGWHCYWPLVETVDRKTWEPLAARLRELCHQHGLIVDSAVFECARVLRIPGTQNFKQDEPAPVEVVFDQFEPYPVEELRELLGVGPAPEEVPEYIPRTSPMMKALLGNSTKSFKKIMMRSAKENGDGCAQLLHAYQEQATIEEPLWRSSLSIAAFCDDRDTATVLMSNQHPEFDLEELEKKVHYLRSKAAPHGCATFDKLRPGVCPSCPHWQKIKSPITLALEVAKAESVDNAGDNGVAFAVDGAVDDDGSLPVPKKHYRVPEPPPPFFFGKTGAIFKMPSPDAEEDPILIYENKLEIVTRMGHPEFGEVVLMRLHLPHDGVREFSLPASSVVVKEKLRDGLAHHGCLVLPKQVENMVAYVGACAKNLQFERSSETMHSQFGWVGDSAFVMGTREVTATGQYYSPPSPATESIAQHVHARGDFHKWRDIINLYAQPGLEPNCFAVLTAFGSPLLRFTGVRGALINLLFPQSGTGKSTSLFAANSVFGHPTELASVARDTANARLLKLGVMGNMHFTIDEITNLPAMEVSELVYAISQGRGKDRVRSSANALRANQTHWCNTVLASSNSSIYEKLSALKTQADAEQMRVLEYRVPPTSIIDRATAKAMFDTELRQNYGHAGLPYIQHLVNNVEDVQLQLRQIQARLDEQIQATSRERFWSAVAACNIVGGMIAMQLNLHNFDMKAVYHWTLHMLAKLRDEVAPPQTGPVATLGDYLNQHMTNALVVNSAVTANGLTAMPLLEPRGELLIRYEPDTCNLYVASKHFRNWCIGQQINHKSVIDGLTSLGVYQSTELKRMAKGMKLAGPAVQAIKLNASQFDSLQLDSKLETDADSGVAVHS